MGVGSWRPPGLTRRSRKSQPANVADSHDAVTIAAKRQLQESEERFRLLVESVRDYAIYLLEPD